MFIGYVINTYPRPSHSFIRREILALERRGLRVQRFAMRGDAAALVDAEDKAEHGRTEHLLAQGAVKLAIALLAALGKRRFWPALRLALRCGRAGAGGTPGTGGRLRHMVYLAEAALLAQRCSALGITHLHAHFGTNATTVAMLTHTLTGLPYSFTVHGPEEFDAPRALALRLKLHHAAFAVAISSFGRSQLMRWCDLADWPKLKVVHCGLDLTAFAPLPPLPRGARRLVSIGRFSEQKGQVLLIDAFAQACQAQPDLHLTLVGDGELRGAIEQAIAGHALQSRVTLTGWQDDAGVRAALTQAQALVLPSFAEGLPVVIMEAMAAARPVIATAIAGVPELVVPGETGWLVPAGDATALAHAIGAFATTPLDDLAALGQAGHRRVTARHGIDASATLLERHFAATCEGSRT